MAVTFGEYIKVEIYGASHADRVGVRIDGLPEGRKIDTQKLRRFMERRAPGRNAWSTSRREPDVPVFLSGVRGEDAASDRAGGSMLKTDGSTLEAVVYNTNVRSEDYANTAAVPRPAHADYPAWVKYGRIAPGGGPFSARMTAPLCIAGGIALQWLEEMGISIETHIRSIGNIEDAPFDSCTGGDPATAAPAEKDFPVIDDPKGEEMRALIAETKSAGDSVGGVIECRITGVPAGTGSPIFGSIESRICQTLYAVPAVKGIEFGNGFAAAEMKGSENNDPFCIEDGRVITETNNHGGILGGLASGMPIVFRAAVKPTPSIATEQDSVNLETMAETKLRIKGRHDPCVVPRAVPCVEAAASLAVWDLLAEEQHGNRRAADGASAVSDGRQAEPLQSPQYIDSAGIDLDGCREAIDRIDRELVALLEERFDVARQVIRYKERRGLPVLDKRREDALLAGLSGFCREETFPYIKEDFAMIMEQSRNFQEEHRLSFGLLGRTLGHSHSPRVHKMLGGYEYGLFERTEDQLDEFMTAGTFQGISVTIPYKRAVIPYCSQLSARAKACNSVNTIVRREDGSLFGDNTDYAGFRDTVEASGVDVSGAKALILGSGGVSGTVIHVLRDLGAGPVIDISRSGGDNYETIGKHSDAQIIVNATPVGMFPQAGTALADLSLFPACKGVFDLIYNPLRTQLMLDAEKRGIPAFGGLRMLVAQAAAAAELFTGKAVPDEKTEEVMQKLQAEMENIVLIGMPGCGKTSVGKRLAKDTGRAFVDLDKRIAEETGRTPAEIITADGINAFRAIETETLRRIVRDTSGGNTETGAVIATGGGIVERDENRDLLRENGAVVYLKRPLRRLPLRNRPVSQADKIETIFARRHKKYETWSDFAIDNNKTLRKTVEMIEQIVGI